MILLEILLNFMQIGVLSIGGGYASLPIIQSQIVGIQGWITMREFADILTISQMTPGPIALNSATFVGMKTAGFPGAIVATIGVILPSFIIVLSIAFLYYKYRQLTFIQAILKGLRPAVVALIASAALSLCVDSFWQRKEISLTTINIESVCLFLLAFFILRKYEKNPIVVMFLTGVVAVIISFWK